MALSGRSRGDICRATISTGGISAALAGELWRMSHALLLWRRFRIRTRCWHNPALFPEEWRGGASLFVFDTSGNFMIKLCPGPPRMHASAPRRPARIWLLRTVNNHTPAHVSRPSLRRFVLAAPRRAREWTPREQPAVDADILDENIVAHVH